MLPCENFGKADIGSLGKERMGLQFRSQKCSLFDRAEQSGMRVAHGTGCGIMNRQMQCFHGAGEWNILPVQSGDAHIDFDHCPVLSCGQQAVARLQNRIPAKQGGHTS